MFTQNGTFTQNGMLLMNEKFFDLKKEKQDRMINASLKVFAEGGYAHASTDDIVREASISKGLLFHYFGSKLGTYAFMYQYSVRFFLLELSAAKVGGSKNVFDMAKQVEQARWQVLKGYPYLLAFLQKSRTENVKEALLETEDMKEKLDEAYEKILADVNAEGLPAGTDAKKLLQMLLFTMDGIMNEQFGKGAFQADMLHEEVISYINNFRNALMPPEE